MSKPCPKCFARKWIEKPNGMCCAAVKVNLPDTEESPEPVKSLLTSDHHHFLNNVSEYNTLFHGDNG